MAYSAELELRIDKILTSDKVMFESKKMMGGICYLVDGKMLAGIVDDKLMARIDPNDYEKAMTMKSCAEMDFTGKSMKGFVFVHPEGIETDTELSSWLRMCLEFNPKAKASKKKKK